jgi:hypothetical protein
MGPRRRSLLLLLLGLAAAASLSACGEGGGAELLPGSTASEISSNLGEVRRLAGEGECVGAQDAALEVSDQIDALGGVDPKLKAALREGATRLNEVVAACQEEGPDEEEEETSPALSTEAEEVEPQEGEKSGKAEKKEPPGQEKKAEKEEKEEPEAKAPPATTPAEPPAEPPAGGTPSGGVAPSAPTEGE